MKVKWRLSVQDITANHGEDVYNEEGVKGRFKKDQTTANIYFQNQSITESRLDRQEEGTKVLRGAYLSRYDYDSIVNLDYRFGIAGAFVSGVVRKSGEAGGAKKVQTQEKPSIMPYEQAQELLRPFVPTMLHSKLDQALSKIYLRE